MRSRQRSGDTKGRVKVTCILKIKSIDNVLYLREALNLCGSFSSRSGGGSNPCPFIAARTLTNKTVGEATKKLLKQ